MRWVRAFVYAISGVFCVVSAFSTQALTAPPGSLLLLAGVALAIIGLRQLTADQRRRVYGTTVVASIVGTWAVLTWIMQTLEL